METPGESCLNGHSNLDTLMGLLLVVKGNLGTAHT